MTRFRFLTPALLVLLCSCQTKDPAAVKQAQAMDAMQCFLRKDLKEATLADIKLVRNLADEGNLRCQLVLGRWYEAGDVVGQDYEKARALYQSVADKDPSANLLLGLMEEAGRGRPADYARARQFYQRASEGGGRSGKLELARLVEQGKGGAVDRQAAFDLYVAATERYRDEGWNEMVRLRKAGLQLNPAQVHRYNELWVKGLTSKTKRWARDKDVQRLSQALDTPTQAIVVYLFKAGSGVPELSLAQSSGDKQLDDVILKAAAQVNMTDEFIFAQGQQSKEIWAPVRLK